MLVASRAKFQKIFLYSVIMFFMFGGTAYMIYDNFIKRPVVEDIGLAGFNFPEAPVARIDAVPAGQSGDSAVKKKAASRAIDIESLTKEEAFLTLKETTVEPVREKPGKKNPFAPYE